MAATKECPSCGTEVPHIAPRCKVCFHDFTEPVRPRSFAVPLLILGMFTVMSVIAAGLLAYMASRPVDMSARVDHDSHSIVFVTKYRTSQETDSVPWDHIAKIEHLTTKQGKFEVNAVLHDGSKRLLAQGLSTLSGPAEEYASAMDKPLDYVDETRNVSTLMSEPTTP